jgi:PKD repeat protein
LIKEPQNMEGEERVRSGVGRKRIRRAAGLLGVPAVGLVIAQMVMAAPPTADFTISDGIPEIGESVSFSATVTDDPGDTHSYLWDFGDGTTSTSENPSHSYTAAGAKTVTLTVTDSAAPPEQTVVSHGLRVNAPPTPVFGFTPLNPNPGQIVQFTSTSSDPEGPVLHGWDLDNDGAFDDGTDPSETTSFNSGGNHTVRLRVTDSDGVQRTIAQTLSVFTNAPPAASFTFSGTSSVTPSVPDVNETVNFVSTSTDLNGDGTIRRMDWDIDNDGEFDDGSGSTLARQFSTAGQKTVGLRVEDSSGATDQVTQTLRVNALPTAAINISNAEREPGQNRTVPLAGQDFTFTSAGVPAIPGSSPATGCSPLPGTPASVGSSDAEGSPSAYEWDLDDDQLYGTEDTPAEPTGATAPSPADGYPAGQRTVGLRVTDSDGARATARLPFRVNAAPTPNFLIEPITPVINQTTTFSSTSSDPDASDTAAALTYSWDLDNDGTFCESGESGPSVSRAFPTASMNPGHPVTLRVTDTGGITRPWTRSIVVQNTIPNGAIAFSPAAPLPGQAITFNGSATSPTGKAIASMEWDFDFNPSEQFSSHVAGTSVTHGFPSAGPKSIALRVTEAGGGFAIVTGTVVVNAPPRAGIGVAPGNPFTGEPVTLSSASGDPDGPLVAQDWDLDNDGAFDDASGHVVSTAFQTPGPKTVRLRVTDSRGAVAIASGSIDVRARPLVVLSGVVIGIKGSVRGRFTRLRRLSVRAPVGAVVTVRCKGKGCPKRAVKRGTGGVVRFKALERRLRARTKVIITVTRPGFIGKHTTYTMRRGRGPKRVDLCLVPGATRASSCPS